jgi:peroxiredoxin
LRNSASRLFLLWLLLLLGLSLAACAQSESVDFTLPDLEGKPRSLSEFRGKWVVVNYWATWCPPCREEMPELEVFHANHKDEDAVVLGVNMETISLARLREFAEEQFISFPILREQPRAHTELGRIPGLPTSYLIDPEGRVAGRQVGPLTLQRLERMIEKLKLARAAAGG